MSDRPPTGPPAGPSGHEGGSWSDDDAGGPPTGRFDPFAPSSGEGAAVPDSLDTGGTTTPPGGESGSTGGERSRDDSDEFDVPSFLRAPLGVPSRGESGGSGSVSGEGAATTGGSRGGESGDEATGWWPSPRTSGSEPAPAGDSSSWPLGRSGDAPGAGTPPDSGEGPVVPEPPDLSSGGEPSSGEHSPVATDDDPDRGRRWRRRPSWLGGGSDTGETGSSEGGGSEHDEGGSTDSPPAGTPPAPPPSRGRPPRGGSGRGDSGSRRGSGGRPPAPPRTPPAPDAGTSGEDDDGSDDSGSTPPTPPPRPLPPSRRRTGGTSGGGSGSSGGGRGRPTPPPGGSGSSGGTGTPPSSRPPRPPAGGSGSGGGSGSPGTGTPPPSGGGSRGGSGGSPPPPSRGGRPPAGGSGEGTPPPDAGGGRSSEAGDSPERPRDRGRALSPSELRRHLIDTRLPDESEEDARLVADEILSDSGWAANYLRDPDGPDDPANTRSGRVFELRRGVSPDHPDEIYAVVFPDDTEESNPDYYELVHIDDLDDADRDDTGNPPPSARRRPGDMTPPSDSGGDDDGGPGRRRPDTGSRRGAGGSGDGGGSPPPPDGGDSGDRRTNRLRRTLLKPVIAGYFGAHRGMERIHPKLPKLVLGVGGLAVAQYAARRAFGAAAGETPLLPTMDWHDYTPDSWEDSIADKIEDVKEFFDDGDKTNRSIDRPEGGDDSAPNIELPDDANVPRDWDVPGGWDEAKADDYSALHEAGMSDEELRPIFEHPNGPEAENLERFFDWVSDTKDEIVQEAHEGGETLSDEEVQQELDQRVSHNLENLQNVADHDQVPGGGVQTPEVEADPEAVSVPEGSGQGITDKIHEIEPGHSGSDYMQLYESAVNKFGPDGIFDGIQTYVDADTGEVRLFSGDGHWKPGVREFIHQEAERISQMGLDDELPRTE